MCQPIVFSNLSVNLLCQYFSHINIGEKISFIIGCQNNLILVVSKKTDIPCLAISCAMINMCGILRIQVFSARNNLTPHNPETFLHTPLSPQPPSHRPCHRHPATATQPYHYPYTPHKHDSSRRLLHGSILSCLRWSCLTNFNPRCHSSWSF